MKQDYSWNQQRVLSNACQNRILDHSDNLVDEIKDCDKLNET